MKKQLIILIIVLLISCVFISDIAYAQGIVPCGRKTDVPDTDINEKARCTICHFFILIDNIVDFLIFNITPPLFLLMLIIGGGMFILASGNPSTITRAKKIITTTLIGVVIIYGAYTLVGLFLQAIGLNTWTKDIYKRWWEDGFFTIDCPVELSDGTVGNPSQSNQNNSTTAPTTPAPVTPTLPADDDRAGDFSYIMNDWGTAGSEKSDLNGDGIVNGLDVLELINAE